MLWFNNWPIEQRRRVFPSTLPQGMLSVHFLLAGQKKVNMGFLFLIVEKESKIAPPAFYPIKALLD